MCAESPRRRVKNKRFPLYAAETLLGWKPLSHVSLAKGNYMVARGFWRQVEDEHGAFAGFQEMPGLRGARETPPRPSSTGLTAREMTLNAGQAFPKGKSRTAGLTEDRRVERVVEAARVGKTLAEEDAVERVAAKVRVYKDLGEKKQDILRVWPREH